MQICKAPTPRLKALKTYRLSDGIAEIAAFVYKLVHRLFIYDRLAQLQNSHIFVQINASLIIS